VHYYQFNIGDYQSHTAHLSDMEDLTYRRMLDWYYLHEKPFPADYAEIARLIRMRSHIDCIAVVLHEFFDVTDAGWIHHRADKEIAKAGEKSNKAKESAKARWNKKHNENKDINTDANALPTQSESNATQDTLHITQDTKHNKKTTVVVAPEGVSIEVWKAFTEQRKKARAVVTDLVIDQIRKEASKINWTLEQAMIECVTRGWRGFKADWIKQPVNIADIARMTVPSTNERDPALVKLDQDKKLTAPPPPEILAKIKEVLNK
jgi:uncharacterized protein YdaU (DUF1376 family)